MKKARTQAEVPIEEPPPLSLRRRTDSPPELSFRKRKKRKRGEEKGDHLGHPVGKRRLPCELRGKKSRVLEAKRGRCIQKEVIRESPRCGGIAHPFYWEEKKGDRAPFDRLCRQPSPGKKEGGESTMSVAERGYSPAVITKR